MGHSLAHYLPTDWVPFQCDAHYAAPLVPKRHSLYVWTVYSRTSDVALNCAKLLPSVHSGLEMALLRMVQGKQHLFIGEEFLSLLQTFTVRLQHFRADLQSAPLVDISH